jgi:hypothetical protein
LAFVAPPSLDLVIYKMGGNNGQYDPTLMDVPQPPLKESREGKCNIQLLSHPVSYGPVSRM